MPTVGVPPPTAPRVGLIAPPCIAVPPPEYGGTELVLDLLARGLRDAGCEVVLFTTGDSTCPVERRWHLPCAVGTEVGRDVHLEHLVHAYRALGDVDLIHDHTALGPSLTDLHPPDVPVVATLHGRVDGSVLARDVPGPGVAVVAISHDQAARARPLRVAAVIHHGLDVGPLPLGAGDGGYVAFLGRMSPDKGVHQAVRVARRAGRRIVIAAKLRERGERRYYADHVAPLLGCDATYVGELGPEAKVRLLAGAEALLNPIRWPEPFGLVMVEALACGTPVLASPMGAAPEIVDHGRTGFLCRDEDDMVARLGDLDRIDRHACRERALRAFSAERMVADHLRLYRSLLLPSPRGHRPRDGRHRRGRGAGRRRDLVGADGATAGTSAPWQGGGDPRRSQGRSDREEHR